ncbi:class I adenylate-forming enzyme family protein [Vineibacter terrae]|uniref:class I adenylate-forming enzyme family protein n=1 Tax=Vineibacter terrae TaxID=2586908 RepID=UPI0015B55BED|nr:AMP-binding protein [Vineibacter terrae]
MIDLFGNPRLGDLPLQAARNWPQRTALVFGDARWTFAELHAAVDRSAWALMRAGFGPGDRIGLWFTNRPEYIFLLFAVSRIGAIAVPLNTRYRSRDMAYCLAQSECNALIYAEQSGPIDYGAILAEVLPGRKAAPGGGVACAAFPHLRRLIAIGDSKIDEADTLAGLIAASGPVDAAAVAARAAAVAVDDLAMIVYTSGTTGNAKGAMLSHAGVRLCILRSVIWGTSFRDVQMHYLPLFHLYAIGFVTVPSIALGASQILMETFEPELALDLAEREKATIVHGFDPHYRDLLDSQRRRARDLGSLRMGSFPSGPDNCVAIVRRANAELCPIYPSFGMTETWGGITAGFMDSDVEQRSEASGFPVPGVEVRIVDPETGRAQPAGALGEIQVRSFSLMQGYYRMPAESEAALLPDGFLRTGDAGYLREDGYLRFTGRYKDMLKVGGENVAPAEVEALLLELPGVLDASVVGYPDDRLNEVAAAFLIVDKAAAVDIAAVQRHCRGRVASFKIPRHVFIVDGFPMTPSGKVQKVKLREVAGRHHAQVQSMARGQA